MEKEPGDGWASTLYAGEPGYPASLAAACPAAPPLRVRGAIPGGRAVAIVGARDASEEGRAFAFALALDLAREGVVVWSGGARGIDAAAHAGALSAGGATVAALGGGLGRLYPPENAALFARIAAQGALVSHVADEAPPLRPGFLERNRILAAATDAIVVVEAGLKSGARRAVASARRLRRPLGVVPHPPWSERGAGCAAELARGGAVAIACSTDVLRLLGVAPSGSPSRRRAAPGVSRGAGGRESALGSPDGILDAGRRGKGDAALAPAPPLALAGPSPNLHGFPGPDLGGGHPASRGPGPRPGALSSGATASGATASGAPSWEAPSWEAPLWEAPARASAEAWPESPPRASQEALERALARVPATRAACARATYDALASLERARGPAHVDAICERTGLPFPAVSEALLTLTLDAVVVEGPAGYYRRR